MKWKPYPSYVDSGVGLIGPIPTHWKTHRIKHLSSIRLSNVDKLTVEGEAPVRLANYVDVYKNERITADMDLMAATASPDQIARLSLLAGDVLITKDSETPDDIGVPAFVPETPEGVVCGYHLAMLRPDAGRLHGAFLHRWLQGNVAKAHFTSHATGMTRYGLGKSDIGDAPMLWAPLDEQAAIAAFLDRETAKIDTLIVEQQTLIERLREKRQAVIAHSITTGLNPDVPRKRDQIEWLGEFPSHWTCKRLKRISPHICVGIVVNPSSYLADDGVPFIYGSDIREGGIDLEGCRKMSPASSASNAKTLLREGDLLTVRVGYPGLTAVVPKDLEGGNCASVMLIRGSSNFCSQWLCHAMNSPVGRSQVEAVQYGAAQEQFNIGHAVEFLFPVPPVQEQIAIAEYIDERLQFFDGLIHESETSIALLQEHRSALITAVVTGKVDVRGAVA